jgi:signal transduction histidine kinase
MSIRLQLSTGFSILILIFILDFFVNQRLSNEVLQNTTYLSNSEVVIRNSNMLHKEMIEMQSGFRGFLLTGQKVFLEPYYDGIRSVPELIKNQRSLISDQQQQRLDSISGIHQKWFSFANDLIINKIDTSMESNQRYDELFATQLRMEVGKKLNDQLQNMFTTFDNYEYLLRQERREKLQRSISRTHFISLLLTIASIILALFSSFYFIRTITRRISKMVSLAEHISKGNFKTITDDRKDELNELSLSLNSMSVTLEKNFKELTKQNKELDQFAYVVSHDLKAPLRGIANIISWIEEDHENDLTPQIKDNLELIKGRTERLEKMINGLLEYARVGKVKKGLEKVNTGSMVLEITHLLVPKSFEVRIEGKMPVLITEKLHLEQIFTNLISNAVKYYKGEKGKITIRAEELSEHYRFSISDNGPGIDYKYFEKIFIIFQTLQERDAFESTGVGLAIVKKIVEDYKGTITVSSEEGKGTTFTFTWPKV